MKKVKFYTLGCKANQYDTQLLRENFLKQGFQESTNGVADIYVVNTCVVTQKAENDSRALANKLQREHPRAEVILAGCLDRYPSDETKGKRYSSDLSEEKISFFAGHIRAFLKIQDGCDNFCSYCIVPYTRGCSRSKPKDKVREEFLQLLKNGYKELVLSGICLGEYGKSLVPSENLAGLLKELEKLEGEFRIRLSSLDPQYISSDLIEIVAKSGKICPHLHIPFQSGDDKILEAMQRGYTAEFAFGLIAKLRKIIPDISVTTDIIVGFPGEEESNFGNTVKFLEFLNPLKVHIFSFSPRPPTPASRLTPKVTADESRKRFALINSMQKNWREDYLKNFLGKRTLVLVEEKSRGTNIFSGYSGHYLKVVFESGSERDCLNDFVSVEGREVREGNLMGTL